MVSLGSRISFIHIHSRDNIRLKMTIPNAGAEEKERRPGLSLGATVVRPVRLAVVARFCGEKGGKDCPVL